MLFRDTVLLLDTLLLDAVRPIDTTRPAETSRSIGAMLFHGRITRTLSVRDLRDPQRSGLS